MEQVDIHVKINQSGRLIEVPTYSRRLLSRNILRHSVKEVIAYMNLPPYTYSEWSGPVVPNWIASAVAIAAEKPFGGGRDALGNATHLHQSIIASGNGIHLSDHWLSYSMDTHLPHFRKIVLPRLDIDYTQRTRIL